MPLYGGSDLHANHSVVVLLGEQDQGIYQQRLSNPLPTILEQLAPYQADLTGVVVESTYNWYWLVAGLMEAGDRVHLAHPAAMPPSSGLKYPDDHSEARWLAHVLRLGVWPQGYIDPKADRALRAMLRKRAHLVRQPTAHGLSGQNILARHPGRRFSAKRMPAFTQAALAGVLPEANQVLAVTSRRALLACLRQQITRLAKAVTTSLQPTPASEQWLSVDGLGTIVAQTSVLATGESNRFPPVGNDASYCRGVTSTNSRHGKRKGHGNGNNGQPYREGASRAAAPFAIRFRPTVQRLYQRKQAPSPLLVARKAVAHKVSRACYDILRDLVPFEVHNAWGCGRATSGVGGGGGEEKWFTTMPLDSSCPHLMTEGLPLEW